MYKVLYIYGNKFNNKETFFHRLIKLFHFYFFLFFFLRDFIKKNSEQIINTTMEKLLFYT